MLFWFHGGFTGGGWGLLTCTRHGFAALRLGQKVEPSRHPRHKRGPRLTSGLLLWNMFSSSTQAMGLLGMCLQVVPSKTKAACQQPAPSLRQTTHMLGHGWELHGTEALILGQGSNTSSMLCRRMWRNLLTNPMTAGATRAKHCAKLVCGITPCS